MQENTESEKPENSEPEKEEIPSEPEETPESTETDTQDSDPQFEEQEGEVLPPETKKKSSAGKLFLFLVIALAGSGAYLYSNNLIPPEILNLIDPKPAPRKTAPLIAKVPPTPLPVEEEPAEIIETPKVIEEEVEAPSPEPSTGAFTPKQEAPVETPLNTEEVHISGHSEEPITSAQISGNKSDLGKSIESKVVSTEEPEVVQEPEKVEAEREVAPEPEDTEETDEDVEQEATQEPETVAIAPTVEAPSTSEPIDTTGPSTDRSESTQAYLDFIESTMQKLGELVLEGINFSWDYLKKKLG